MSYATVDQLRAYLQQIPAGSGNDGLLQDVLDRATDMIRSTFRAQLGDPLFDFADDWPAASTRIVMGYPSEYLPLPPFKPESVTLVERQISSSPIAWEAVTATWAEDNTSLYRGSGWYFDRYRITAIWGYGPVPPAIVELCLEIAVNLWRAKDRGGYTEVVGLDGSGGIRVVTGLNRQQLQIVADVVAYYWRPAV